MTRILLKVLEYITWWVPILVLLLPVAWAIIYHNWYKYYRERKSVERWKRLEEFFTKNDDKDPDAASSFWRARFYASPQGYEMMYRIKKAEYYK